MKIEKFIETYKGRLDLSSIPWDHFPEELQMECLKFISEWQANISIDDLRNLSGFNEMSVEDLLRYAKGDLEEDIKPLGCPYQINLL